MISSAAAQPVPAASAPQQAASSPMPAASAPQATVIAQTIQPINNMPGPNSVPWWQTAGLIPSIAAVIAVCITAWSVHRNTSRQLQAARHALDETIRDSNAKADADRKHTAHEAKLDREDAATRAQKDREHEAEVAKFDRLMDARRAIYGEILADYQKVQALIGGLANAGPDEPEDFMALSAMSASVNKVWIWGEVESAYQVREFYSQVNEFFYEALGKARIIKELKRELANLDTYLADREAVIVRLQTKLEAQPEAFGNAEWQNNRRRLSEDISRVDRELRDAMDSRSRRSLQLARRRLAYFEFVIDKQAEAMNQINIVMASARADVGLKGDLTKLEAQSNQMSVRVRAAIAKMEEESEEDL